MMQHLAVVPIFMSAGAAVLPTVVAALTSVVAILFKPRELLRLCRQRPMMMGGVAVALALMVGGMTWYLMLPPPPALAVHDKQTDWARVGQDILAQEPLHRVAVGSPPKVPPSTASSTMAATHVARQTQDLARTLFGGGPSPTKLVPVWSFRPEDTLFLAVPAISGKRIFIAGCQADLGGYTGLLACVDADTGKPIWQITDVKEELLKPFFSSPSITADGKYMVIGQGLHEDRDCSLLCLEVATGKLAWAAKTSLHIESSPAIFGDMAVVGAGAIEGRDGRPTGDPGFVMAIRISDGKELWRQAVNDPESAPVIDDAGVVFIGSGFNGNAVVAIRSETDEQLREKKLSRIAWKTPTAYPVTGPLSLFGDVVIAGGGNSDLIHSNRDPKGQVLALDRKTGNILWQITTEDSILGAIACRDNVLICPSRTGEILALSLKDGSILWRTPISGNAPCVAGCAFTDKYIYAVSTDGYLAILDRASGKILERVFVNDPAKPGTGLTVSSPQVFDGRVLIGTETGGVRLYAGTAGGAK